MANLASDVVKMGSFTGRKPSKASTKAGSKVNVVDIVAEEKRLDLSERETWAVKRFFSIEKTQGKQLVELKDIGAIILELRSLYPSDKQFGKEVENTPDKTESTNPGQLPPSKFRPRGQTGLEQFKSPKKKRDFENFLLKTKFSSS